MFDLLDGSSRHRLIGVEEFAALGVQWRPVYNFAPPLPVFLLLSREKGKLGLGHSTQAARKYRLQIPGCPWEELGSSVDEVPFSNILPGTLNFEWGIALARSNPAWAQSNLSPDLHRYRIGPFSWANRLPKMVSVHIHLRILRYRAIVATMTSMMRGRSMQ